MPFNWTWELAFSPDGTMLASGAGDGVIRFWGIGTPGPPTPTPRFSPTPTLLFSPTPTPVLPTRTRIPTPTPVLLEAEGLEIKFHSYTSLPEDEQTAVHKGWVAYKVTNRTQMTFVCVDMSTQDVATGQMLGRRRHPLDFKLEPKPVVYSKDVRMLAPGETKYLVHYSSIEPSSGAILNTVIKLYTNQDCRGDDFVLREFQSTVP
jgi:hypothetical protein